MDNYKQEPRSLIMCTTPLQMLIAEKIIEMNLSEKFDVIIIVPNNNEKYNYYYNKLKEKCLTSLFYIPTIGMKSFLDFLKQLKKSKLNKKYKCLYLASIDSRYFQYLVSRNSLANIYTFDDGTANIIPSSIYYSEEKLSKLKKIIWRFLGVKYFMSEIKEKSQLHYTLYKNIPNIIKNTKYISLLPLLSSSYLSIEKVVKFYLGQPLMDISKKFDHNFIKSKIENIDIDYYYPHPREKEYPKGNYEIIESSLIFEDFIIKFLIENPHIKVEIYSFISTALLNLVEIKRVKLIYICDENLYDLHKDFYHFVEDFFNVPHLKLD